MKKNNTSTTETDAKSNAQITLHWWNMGSKKLDFKGTVSEYFKEKGFKVTTHKHPRSKEVTGFRFKFEVSNRYLTFDVYHYPIDNASIEAIQLFLTMLGDKATITTNFKQLRINH